MFTNPYLNQSQSNKIQNYSQYRSAENPRIPNHFHKPYSLNKKQSPSNRLYMRNRTNMNNNNNEDNSQQYCRYRNATYQSPNKTCQFLFPCYTQLKHQNENEYSRFRDSQSSRKNSANDATIKIHKKCRNMAYDSHAMRFPVPDDKVLWTVKYPEYKPVEYTTDKIQHNPRADLIDPMKIDKYHEIDHKIDRTSFTGQYHVDPVTNRPQNPRGRTGITGRGRLYHWGPNHAGDPVVTRWVRDKDGAIVYREVDGTDQLKPVLAFVSIQRQDTKQWALPGGMVDPGEHVSQTVKREFQEEAVRGGIDKASIDRLFSNGHKLYANYVDDPRNTDNAWLETVAVHFHDENGELTKNLHLEAGDDAEKVVWRPIDHKLELYACHKYIIEEVVKRLDAYW